MLEAGCGIGAQTVILAKNSPGARITSVDISEDSLKRAQEKVRQEGITNVTFRQGGYVARYRSAMKASMRGWR